MRNSTVLDLIRPDWPAPANVRALSTTRIGGVSAAPYDSFNIASHVDDDSEHVMANRRLLMEQAELPAQPYWLQQVHSDRAVRVGDADTRADASWSDSSAEVCAVMTADCLPVLLCDCAGNRVAAAHAGWRGLHAGVIESSLEVFDDRAQVLAWMGPAIGPAAFEVGEEVYAAFTDKQREHAVAFTSAREGHWMCDLYTIARNILRSQGVTSIYGGEACTFTDTERFFSYRRDGITGRMASLIWMV